MNTACDHVLSESLWDDAKDHLLNHTFNLSDEFVAILNRLAGEFHFRGTEILADKNFGKQNFSVDKIFSTMSKSWHFRHLSFEFNSIF